MTKKPTDPLALQVKEMCDALEGLHVLDGLGRLVEVWRAHRLPELSRPLAQWMRSPS
ncbi:MAG: hypothetical protein JST92_03880 [Deltaproteobacteria bacterium]|nr:hypothetical protein [Deltaproteobacteria bacterium]